MFPYSLLRSSKLSKRVICSPPGVQSQRRMRRPPNDACRKRGIAGFEVSTGRQLCPCRWVASCKKIPTFCATHNSLRQGRHPWPIVTPKHRFNTQITGSEDFPRGSYCRRVNFGLRVLHPKLILIRQEFGQNSARRLLSCSFFGAARSASISGAGFRV